MRRHPGQAAFVLPSTLMATSVLLVVVVALAAVSRLELRSSTYLGDRERARYAAFAGLELAKTRLMAAKGPEFDYGKLAAAGETAIAADAAGVPLHTDALDLGMAAVRVMVRDECACLPLNLAGRDELAALPGMRVELADPILDWRDADDEPREYGAESDWYNQDASGWPVKNGNFDTLDELCLVKGFSKRALTGTDEAPGLRSYLTVWSMSPEMAPDGKPKLDLRSVTAPALKTRLGGKLTPAETNAIAAYAANPGFQRLGQIFAVPGMTRARIAAIVDFLAIGAEPVVAGRVNLNTTGAEVLAALPGASAETAAAIIRAREDEGPFQALSGLVGRAEIPVEALASMIDRVTVGSLRFGVTADGEAGRARVRLFAVLDLAEAVPRVVYASYRRFGEEP